MVLLSESGECEVTACALGGRIRTRLRLDLLYRRPLTFWRPFASCLVTELSRAGQTAFPRRANIGLKSFRE
jgi:hypothetical protein